MHKQVLILVAVLFLVAPATSQLYHEIDLEESYYTLNSSVGLECSGNCPVNSWNLEWNIPDNAEVISVRDSMGEIEEYSVQNGKISLSTNSGPRRQSETVQMVFNVSEPAEEVHNGLYKTEISLPGFSERKTDGFVRQSDIISGWTSYGFQTSYTNDTMKFSGEGPINLRVKHGKGERTKYYEFFGPYEDNTSKAYEISVGTTGLSQTFDRFPVAVLPSGDYDDQINSWSAGEYVSGSMVMRQGLETDFMPVLAHETVHGLNDRELNWDETRSSYFDEGTAKYVEFLTRLKIMSDEGQEAVKPPGELFGDRSRWDPDPNDQVYQEVPPKGDRDELWNYYRQDRDFMKTWSTSDSNNRDFGYAYSELIIRNYVVENNSTVRELYRNLSVNRKVSDPEEKWQVFSQHLDMRPCKSNSREEFDQCLEEINDYEYSVYTAQPSGEREDIELDKVRVPEARFESQEYNMDRFLYELQMALQHLRNVLQDIFFSLIRAFL